jgi:hypothetical protein
VFEKEAAAQPAMKEEWLDQAQDMYNKAIHEDSTLANGV